MLLGKAFASSSASSSVASTNNWICPANNIESLVRLIAVKKSFEGGHKGALPAPSIIFSRGKCNSWALCNEVSRTLLIIWTVPARLDVGVKITVNSDDPPFFNASIAGEYEVMRTLGLSDDELKSLTTNAVEHSFCDEDTKLKLLNKI